MLVKALKKEYIVAVFVILALTLVIPAVSGQTLVEVWTDKPSYYVGESVRIYFRISADAYIEIWLKYPDGTLRLLYKGNVKGGEIYFLTGTAGCPTGVRTVFVKAWIGGQYFEGTTSYEVQLTLRVLAEVYIFENYTVDVVLKYKPEHTSWSQFYSLCFSRNPSKYYLTLKNYAADLLGLVTISEVSKGYSGVEGVVYVKCRGDLKYSALSEVEKGIIKLKDPLFEKGEGWLDEMLVYCERGVTSVSPAPYSITKTSAKWINPTKPGTGIYEVVTYYYVNVTAEGLPVGVKTTVFLNGKPYGEVGSGECLIVKIKGGEKGEITVLEEISHGGKVFRVEDALFASVEKESSLVFKYSEMVKLSITSNYVVAVKIDGSEAATPLEYWVKPGTEVTISAPEVYEIGVGERLVFAKWSDGSKELNRKIRVLESTSLSLEYKRQFYVDVRDPQGVAYGGGWYDEGSTAKIGVKETVVKIGEGERFVFDSWSGDISSKKPVIEVQVSSPLTVTARWRHQYRVEVSTKYSEVRLNPYSPDGWYDEGTRLVVEIREEKVDDTSFTTVKFAGWIDKTNETTYKTPRFEITVNRPLKIEAVWKRRLRLLPLIVLGSLIAILIIVVAVFLFLKFGRPSVV